MPPKSKSGKMFYSMRKFLAAGGISLGSTRFDLPRLIFVSVSASGSDCATPAVGAVCDRPSKFQAPRRGSKNVAPGEATKERQTRGSTSNANALAIERSEAALARHPEGSIPIRSDPTICIRIHHSDANPCTVHPYATLLTRRRHVSL